MARFYAEIPGSRGEATRMGSESSGIDSHIRGWDIGVKVHCYVESDGKDVCIVSETGGSNNPSAKREITRIKEGDIQKKLI